MEVTIRCLVSLTLIKWKKTVNFVLKFIMYINTTSKIPVINYLLPVCIYIKNILKKLCKYKQNCIKNLNNYDTFLGMSEVDVVFVTTAGIAGNIM